MFKVNDQVIITEMYTDSGKVSVCSPSRKLIGKIGKISNINGSKFPYVVEFDEPDMSKTGFRESELTKFVGNTFEF